MIKTARISMYSDAYSTASADTSLLQFLDDIRSGVWQDMVLPIRVERDENVRREMKKSLPGVTISGIFKKRSDNNISAHSGYISIDIDKLDAELESARTILSKDPYVFACFTSVSGTGICAIIPIDGSRHRDAFAAISAYLYDNYQFVVDQTGKNESRLRFVSFDPDLFINEDAARFKRYLPKEKPRKIPKVVYVQSDFDEMVNTLAPHNICERYLDWVSVGYALVDKFGEGGRQYYHTLSSCASKYDAGDCDRMYSTLTRYASQSRDKMATIATIYYFAKQHNIPFYSGQTQRILSSFTLLRKSGMGETAIVENLLRFNSIPAEASAPVVSQAFQQNITFFKEDDSQIARLEQWLGYNYEFRRNAISRKIEVDGKEMDGSRFNNIYVAAKKVFDKSINTEMLERLVNSSFTPDHNPLVDFFTGNPTFDGPSVLDEYVSCITTDKPDYFKYFFCKWYVGIVASCHGIHCPLMLVYTGRQGSGKTQAFRDLLPPSLRDYYAESKLDLGKDDEILMTQKLIICDDEMGGKSKAESRRMKELTSKQTFSLREPYGRHNVDLHRLAVLCGTTNDPRVLNDPTGNRRIIPINIESIDFKRINKIDRTSMLMEGHKLWKSGFTHLLDSEEVVMMNNDIERFNEYSSEYELIMKYYRQPGTGTCDELTATDIKVHLELKSLQKLNINKIGQELQRIGYVQVIKKIDGRTKRVYLVDQIGDAPAGGYKPVDIKD